MADDQMSSSSAADKVGLVVEFMAPDTPLLPPYSSKFKLGSYLASGGHMEVYIASLVNQPAENFVIKFMPASNIKPDQRWVFNEMDKLNEIYKSLMDAPRSDVENLLVPCAYRPLIWDWNVVTAEERAQTTLYDFLNTNATFFSLLSSDFTTRRAFIANLAESLLKAVHQLHKKEICHMDLTPLNIFLMNTLLFNNGVSKRFCWLVGDFSSAEMSADGTSLRGPFGTSSWGAPEIRVADRFNPSKHIDLFEIGACLYWALTAQCRVGEPTKCTVTGVDKSLGFDSKLVTALVGADISNLLLHLLQFDPSARGQLDNHIAVIENVLESLEEDGVDLQDPYSLMKLVDRIGFSSHSKSIDGWVRQTLVDARNETKVRRSILKYAHDVCQQKEARAGLDVEEEDEEETDKNVQEEPTESFSADDVSTVSPQVAEIVKNIEATKLKDQKLDFWLVAYQHVFETLPKKRQNAVSHLKVIGIIANGLILLDEQPAISLKYFQRRITGANDVKAAVFKLLKTTLGVGQRNKSGPKKLLL